MAADTLIAMLTVEEMLMYTAELKRSMKESLECKKQAVAELLEKLALGHCKDVKIGDTGSKVTSRAPAGIVTVSPETLSESTSLAEATTGEKPVLKRYSVRDMRPLAANVAAPTPMVHPDPAPGWNRPRTLRRDWQSRRSRRCAGHWPPAAG